MAFQPVQACDWQSYSSACSDEGKYLSVSADRGQSRVRVAVQTEHHGSSLYLSPQSARELAAELIGAAESLTALKVDA